MPVFIGTSPCGRAWRRNIAAGADQCRTCTIAFTLFGRLVVAELGTIFRIQRFRATAGRFKRQPVPTCKFSQVRICARKPVRNSSLWSGDLWSGLASEDAERLAGIQIPVITSNKRLGQKYRIFDDTDNREPVCVARPMFGQNRFVAAR